MAESQPPFQRESSHPESADGWEDSNMDGQGEDEEWPSEDEKWPSDDGDGEKGPGFQIDEDIIFARNDKGYKSVKSDNIKH